jgi:hypothetical protein
MNDTRVYRVTMPDGSEWDLPVQGLKENWMTLRLDNQPVRGNLLARARRAFRQPYQIRNQALKVRWEDLWDNEIPVCHKPAENPDPSHYAEGWINGEWRVLKRGAQASDHR